jgi:hypothetical protein
MWLVLLFGAVVTVGSSYVLGMSRHATAIGERGDTGEIAKEST